MNIKKLFIIFSVTAFFACSTNNVSNDILDQAENACAAGRYSKASEFADSIMSSRNLDNLSVDQLCRLSLVFMRLSENTTEIETNAANAARCLKHALDRESDSTRIFLNHVPVDDQARVALMLAISEAHDAPIDTDSLFFEEHDHDHIYE